MNRLIKNPFLHCLIIGLLVALSSQWIPQQTTIFLHHSEITALQKELSESINGRAVEFNRSAQLLAEQEILFLEAKKSGFDKVDSVILRLANIAEFLQLADTDQSLDEKYQAALAMNLDETDIIVRRQMISIYQATLRNSMPAKIPSDQAINDWYQRHHSSFIEAPKYAFSHVYLSSDKAHSDSSISINLLENSAQSSAVMPTMRLTFLLQLHWAMYSTVATILIYKANTALQNDSANHLPSS